MSNERFVLVIFVILGVLFLMLLADRTTCRNPDGTPCRFGGPMKPGKWIEYMLEHEPAVKNRRAE